MTPSETYVVVGASTGLGRATARQLAREHRVIVAGRDVSRTHAAVPGAALALPVDLADLADVRRFARALVEHGPISGLVCNAGTQDAGAPSFTKDGLESTFAVNHLAHFAIALTLLPAFAPGARVAFVGSGTLEPTGATAFGFRGGRYTTARALARGEGDPAVSEAQRAKDRYATSKLCNLLAMAAIARRTDRITPVALDPGLMPGTGLARQQPAALRFVWHTVLRAAAWGMSGTSTPARSGRALAWLVTTPGPAGRYVDYRRRARSWTGSDRSDWAEDLYATSLELCGFPADPLA